MSTEQKLQEINHTLSANTKAITELTLAVQALTLNREHDKKMTSILGNKVDSLQTSVYGCTESKVTGLLTKMDRVEQIEDSRKWNLRAIWVAVIGILAGIVKDMTGWGGS